MPDPLITEALKEFSIVATSASTTPKPQGLSLLKRLTGKNSSTKKSATNMPAEYQKVRYMYYSVALLSF
jgi:hypothetical protein